MKINESGNPDEALHSLLKEWRVAASLPPRFLESVWRRIERAEEAPPVWTFVAHWVGTMLPRPALAVSYVVILLAIGVSGGMTQARQETKRVKNELGERYVRVLDPYQVPHK